MCGTIDCFPTVCWIVDVRFDSGVRICGLSSDSFGLTNRPAEPLKVQSACYQAKFLVSDARDRYLVLFDRINRHSWFFALLQLEHGNPTTEASHLIRFLLHLSHAVALRCLWVGLWPAVPPAAGDSFEGALSIDPLWRLERSALRVSAIWG